MLRIIASLLFANVLLTHQSEILGTDPTIPRISLHKISQDTGDGLGLHWHPVESETSNKIIGYKLKVWEMKNFKTYQIHDDIKGLIEYQDYDYFKGVKEIPNYDPVLYKILPGANSSSTKIQGLQKRIFYSIRIQAYSAVGDGPLSQGTGIRAW